MERRPKVDQVYNNRAAAFIAIGKIRSAKGDLDTAIGLNRRNAHALFNRGEVNMILARWDEAKADLLTARELGLNVVELFRREFSTLGEFEKKYDVELPVDIVELLTSNG